eukprot:5036473-Amphidinium_carterae.1
MDIYLVNAALSALKTSGNVETCLGLLRNASMVSLQPDSYSFASTISACKHASAWHQAVGLLHMADDARVSRNVVMCTAAMAACVAATQWRRALHIFKTSSLRPNTYMYNVAIDALAASANWQEAERILATMQKARQRPDAVTFSAVISACEKGGRSAWHRVPALLKAAFESGVIPDASLLGSASGVLARSLLWRELLEVLELRLQHGVPPDIASYVKTLTACLAVDQG